jgi:hypothetical protein
MKKNTDATILEIEHDRKYFRNRVLHLDSVGKETIGKQIKETVEKNFYS